MHRKHGDAGTVAREAHGAKEGKKQSTLAFMKRGGGALVPPTLWDVWVCFSRVATINAAGGQGVNDRKVGALLSLLARLTTADCGCYFVRLLISNARIGCNILTILDALAEARTMKDHGRTRWEKGWNDSIVKKAKGSVRRGYAVSKNDVTVICEAVSGSGGISAAEGLRPVVGRAVASMLGSPSTGFEDVLEGFKWVRMEAEYKYDGVRAQVHWMGLEDGVRVFSRHSEEVSHS